ncbi:hypothetical protein BC332_25799 [Capsicum chinense]|nr:hypothetical protein BC332_25799 [Capsicum chinense]
MSLALIQGYSSADEEEQEHEREHESQDHKSSDEENDDVTQNRYKPFFDPNPSSSSLLPSALDAFSEISGPPEFLNSVEEAGKDVDVQRHGHRKYSRNKNDLPAGAIVESKAQLVGIHERVRSDVGGGIPKTVTGQANAFVGTVQRGKPMAIGSYHGAEDAIELLRYGVKIFREGSIHRAIYKFNLFKEGLKP